MQYKTELLKYNNGKSGFLTENNARYYADRIDSLFSDYKINAHVGGIRVSESALGFRIELGEGVKAATIKNLQHDLEYRLGLEVTIVQSNSIEIYLKSDSLPCIRLRNCIEDSFTEKSEHTLKIAAGVNDDGDPIVIDLERGSHLLVTGTTGAGKSVFLDDVILSLIYNNTPAELKLLCVDVKGVDLRYYNSLPHMICDSVENRADIADCLETIVGEIDQRLSLFARNNVKNIDEYNKIPDSSLERIVVVIDEYMELVSSWARNGDVPRIEKAVASISEKGRMAGVHLVLATQHDSSVVIKGKIRSNFHYVVNLSNKGTFKVKDRKLRGSGEMAFVRTGDGSEQKVTLGKAAFVTGDEVIAVVRNIAERFA